MDDEQQAPDPRKITIVDGILFNPWVNTAMSLACTIGMGLLALYFWGNLQGVQAAPAYPDQQLDVAGLTIGVIVSSLITIVLFVGTIWVIVWWAKRGWRV